MKLIETYHRSVDLQMVKTQLRGLTPTTDLALAHRIILTLSFTSKLYL